MSAIADPERTLHPLALELNFAAPAVEEVKKGDTKELWVDILREGEIKTTPGQTKKVPFTVIASGPSSSTRRVISFEDIIKGFDAKAFPDVTIPDGHPKPDRLDPKTRQVIKGDSALNNTGYVRSLRVVQKDVNLGDEVLKDCHVLQADMGFTEPSAAEKAKRGTIPNVSSGIFFDWVRKADDRYFPCALNHVALTKNPWITGLEGFPKMFFGDDTFHQEGVEFEIVNLDDAGDGADNNDAKVIWNDNSASAFIRRGLEAALNPPQEEDPTKPYVPRAYYYVEDVTHMEPNLARVEESYRGKQKSWVIPYSIGDDGLPSPAPSIRWIEGRTAMIAASDTTSDPLADFADKSQNKLRQRLTVALSDLLGEGPAKDHVIEETSTDERALLRNKANGGVYLAQFRDCGSALYFSEPSSWETIKAPGTTSNKESVKVTASTTPTFDLSTPEGRVQKRRHDLRQR